MPGILLNILLGKMSVYRKKRCKQFDVSTGIHKPMQSDFRILRKREKSCFRIDDFEERQLCKIGIVTQLLLIIIK